jgi:hypothetical protein
MRYGTSIETAAGRTPNGQSCGGDGFGVGERQPHPSHQWDPHTGPCTPGRYPIDVPFQPDAPLFILSHRCSELLLDFAQLAPDG